MQGKKLQRWVGDAQKRIKETAMDVRLNRHSSTVLEPGMLTRYRSGEKLPTI